MKRLLLAAAVSAACLASPAAAGTLIVAGDATIAFRTNTGGSTGAASLAGNVTFARNLLGSGDSVLVFGSANNFRAPGELTAAFGRFPGVTATSTGFTGSITTAALAGQDVLLAFDPSRAFTSAEAAAIAGFLAGGGTVFLAGEASTDPFGSPLGRLANGFLNGLLASLGSTIRLGEASLDISDQFATGSEIVANPLTAGVGSFGYGLTTTVSGGDALFLTNGGQTFVATQQIGAIPEPATWATMIGGFALVGGAMRRRRRNAAVA